ncbi:FixH family protein [Neobacillus niacini]|uniref:FixH family protein n=1 Tax=Neobacillus niacini TaxID=86668 RepID=UPI0007AC064B|nr:FixH family protein [Neobacillus niacini]MEC1521338.1 FixH family protein [Neobacillus niacini]
MRKYLFFMLIIVSVLSISACNNKDKKADELPEFVEVELTINPEKGNVNEPIVFEAKVTQGDENVEDADEVTFEIWRAHDEKHEKIKVEHTENGIYRLEKSFQQEGTYYIISHVTARDMHNMPKKEFVVGTASEPEDPSESKDSMKMEGH